MRVLHHHRILPLYDLSRRRGSVGWPKGKETGRPSILRDGEVITILVFNLFTVQQQAIRQIYDRVVQCHQSDFPTLPNYQNFLKHCHRVGFTLDGLLMRKAQLRFMDSTMIEVCKPAPRGACRAISYCN